MSKEDKDAIFNESISQLTLAFKDEKAEESFQKAMGENKYFGIGFMLVAYPMLIIMAAYRVIAIASAYTTNFMKTADKEVELILFLGQTASLLIEIALRFFPKAKFFNWFCFYTAFRILAFAAAFYTQKQPVFGMTSAMTFSIIFSVSLLFLHSWVSTALSGIVVNVYVFIDYIRLFSSQEPLGSMIMGLFLSFATINSTTAFAFSLEKGYRKLYFLEQEMKKERKHWKTTLNCLPVGVVVVDSGNRLQFVNKEAANYLSPGMKSFFAGGTGRANGENTNKTAANASFKDYVENSVSSKRGETIDARLLDIIADSTGITLKRAIEKAGNESEDLCYDMKHGKTNKVYEVKTKLSNTHKIAVVKDQTVYQQLVKEQVLEKYLRMLLASISHEVRNPLNVISGYVSIISETKDLSAIQDIISKLQYAALHINYIVNGACYLVMAEDGTIVLQPEEFRLTGCIEDAIDTMSCSIDNGT